MSINVTGFSMKMTDKNQEILNEFGKKAEKGLFAAGATAEKYAKENITRAGRVDTGRLRASITHATNINHSQAEPGAKPSDYQLKGKVDGLVVVIGTNVEYAPFIEYGTGKYASPPFVGRKKPWMVVPDGAGKYKEPFWTAGIRPCHFLKNAIDDHKTEYEKIIKEALKS